MSECIRCGKTFFDINDSIHTCSPSKVYRAGMEEGTKKAEAKLEKAIAFIRQLAEDDCIDAHYDYAPCDNCTSCYARELLKELEE